MFFKSDGQFLTVCMTALCHLLLLSRFFFFFFVFTIGSSEGDILVFLFRVDILKVVRFSFFSFYSFCNSSLFFRMQIVFKPYNLPYIALTDTCYFNPLFLCSFFVFKLAGRFSGKYKYPLC